MTCYGCGAPVKAKDARWVTPPWSGPGDPQGPEPFCSPCYDLDQQDEEAR